MSRISPLSRRWSVIAIVAIVVCWIVPTPAAPSSPRQQASALADLMSGFLDCSVHPCIGTEAGAFDALIRGQYVSDGDFYTDFGMAYPGFAHLLQGVVIWDVDDTVDGAFFIFTRFYAHPAVLIAELASGGFECIEEDDPEEGQQEWYCGWPDEDDYEFDLYVGNGVLLLEY